MTTTQELIERLRDSREPYWTKEAADRLAEQEEEIKTLLENIDRQFKLLRDKEAEIDRLRGALKFYAKWGDQGEIARAALEQKPNETPSQR